MNAPADACSKGEGGRGRKGERDGETRGQSICKPRGKHRKECGRKAGKEKKRKKGMRASLPQEPSLFFEPLPTKKQQKWKEKQKDENKMAPSSPSKKPEKKEQQKEGSAAGKEEGKRNPR